MSKKLFLSSLFTLLVCCSEAQAWNNPAVIDDNFLIDAIGTSVITANSIEKELLNKYFAYLCSGTSTYNMVSATNVPIEVKGPTLYTTPITCPDCGAVCDDGSYNETTLVYSEDYIDFNTGIGVYTWSNNNYYVDTYACTALGTFVDPRITEYVLGHYWINTVTPYSYYRGLERVRDASFKCSSCGRKFEHDRMDAKSHTITLMKWSVLATLTRDNGLPATYNTKGNIVSLDKRDAIEFKDCTIESIPQLAILGYHQMYSC